MQQLPDEEEVYGCMTVTPSLPFRNHRNGGIEMADRRESLMIHRSDKD